MKTLYPQWQQQCIPVGCVPPTFVAATRYQYWGSLSGWEIYCPRGGSLSRISLCLEGDLCPEEGDYVQRGSLSKRGSISGEWSLSRGSLCLERVSFQRGYLPPPRSIILNVRGGFEILAKSYVDGPLYG